MQTPADSDGPYNLGRMTVPRENQGVKQNQTVEKGWIRILEDAMMIRESVWKSNGSSQNNAHQQIQWLNE
jgi:hypothetical protein